MELMEFNHKEGVPASSWSTKSGNHELYLTTTCDNGTLVILPSPDSNSIPVATYEYPYRGGDLNLQEAQQSQIDLLCGRICLPVSSPEYADADHFTWLSQQPGIHDHPVDMTLGRQIRPDCTSLGPSGKEETNRGPGTNTRERKRASGSDKRHAHSIIERRYRDKVNNKLKELYHTLREVRYQQQLRAEASGCVVLSEPKAGMRKSDVINDAITYIHESEINFRHMADEIQSLKIQLGHVKHEVMN